MTLGAPVPSVSRPRLIVTDLDGTFLSPDGTVSERNARAVRSAEEAGIPVVFATGRPIRYLEPIQGLCTRHTSVIASNGAMSYDLATGTVLSSRLISAELAAEAFRTLRAEVAGVAFGVDSGSHAAYERDYLTRHGAEAFLAVDDPSRCLTELPELVESGEFVKLLVLASDTEPDALTAQVSATLGDRLTATHSSPSRALVEVSAAGVSKAATLAELCRGLGIAPHEVAAFGDMPNDLEMLRWSGMPYVMGQAHPDVLRCGATVIGSNADSAVGATIEKWL